MKKTRPRGVWFKLALALGAALGVLLLVQSMVIYFQVSKDMVTAELGREARARATALEREYRRLGVQTPETLEQLLEEIRQAEPNKIAWIRVMDLSGQPVAQSGGPPAGPIFDVQQVRLANNQGTPIYNIRDTPAGRVMTYAYPVCLGRQPRPGEPASEIPAGSPRYRGDRPLLEQRFGGLRPAAGGKSY